MTDIYSTTPLARVAQRDQDQNEQPSHYFVILDCAEPKRVGEKIPVDEGKTLRIGRSQATEIAFPENDSLSRVHATVESNRAGVAICDKKSTNGVVVNGDDIETTVYLRDGDTIELGYVRLRFATDAATRQAETLYRLVNTDELTGAYNRRRFQEVIVAECIRAKRYQRPLSLILFDVDKFKEVNDTHGHPVGDEVLRGIVALAIGTLREGDLVARLGGDEFAVLCLEADVGAAESLAERLRVAIHNELDLSVPDLKVTCSFGVAGRSYLYPTPEAMQLGADRALYRSKEAGRNAVNS